MADKKKILLIDDEENICFFVKNNLEATGGFEVITTTDGQEGLQLAKQKKPDLILLDIIMPKMSGSDVAENLFLDSRTKHIPVVFLTAVVTQREIGIESVKEIGGQYFVAKPFDTEKLVDSIKMVLEEKSNAQAA